MTDRGNRRNALTIRVSSNFLKPTFVWRFRSSDRQVSSIASLVRTRQRSNGGTSHPEVALSPRFSLRRTKTASEEPTPANQLAWRCPEEVRIYEENRSWTNG